MVISTTIIKTLVMRRVFLFLTLLQITFWSQAQEMTGERLVMLLAQESDTIDVQGNTARMLFNERLLICIYDEGANRMRIISPIVERKELDEEQLLNALVANFHSVLDVKYALSDELIWSVYAHPLKELSDAQVIDAMQQVYAAAITFGGSYSSTNLVFPGNTKREEKKPAVKSLKKT